MQAIGVHGEFLNRAVTLLVISEFESFSSAPKACVDFRDPTAFFRVKPEYFKMKYSGFIFSE